MFGQRQVVGVVSPWQAEGIGQDKRLIVQPHGVVIIDGEGEEVVEMLSRCNERKPVSGPHALTQDVGHLKWQQRGRNDRLVCLRGRLVESDGPIASFLIENPLDRDRRVRADHDN